MFLLVNSQISFDIKYFKLLAIAKIDATRRYIYGFSYFHILLCSPRVSYPFEKDDSQPENACLLLRQNNNAPERFYHFEFMSPGQSRLLIFPSIFQINPPSTLHKKFKAITDTKVLYLFFPYLPTFQSSLCTFNILCFHLCSSSITLQALYCSSTIVRYHSQTLGSNSQIFSWCGEATKDQTEDITTSPEGYMYGKEIHFDVEKQMRNEVRSFLTA